jgi:hypothetical protein
VLSHEILRLDEGAAIVGGPAHRHTPKAAVNSAHELRAIYDNYSQVIEQNWARRSAWSARKLVDNLSDQELHDQLVYYHVHVGTQQGLDSLLMQVLGNRLDAVRLSRVQTIDLQAIADSRSYDGSKWIDMTPTQIYEELRSAYMGGASLPVAMYQTVTVIGLVWGAWDLGYDKIGPVVNDLMEAYTPNLYTAVGMYVDSGVTYLSEQYTWTGLGQAEQYLGEVFNWNYQYGMPVGAAGAIETSGGDYSVDVDWELGYEEDWGAVAPRAGRFDARHSAVLDLERFST